MEMTEFGLTTPLILTGSLSHKFTHSVCEFKHHSSCDPILSFTTAQTNPRGAAYLAALRESAQRRKSEG